MARDPNDVALEQVHPDYFAKRAAEMGAQDVGGLSDAEYRMVANEIFRAKATEQVASSKLPGWLERAAKVGLTEDSLVRLSEGFDPWGVTSREQAAQKLLREARRMGGLDGAQPKENPYFDDPCSDYGKSRL